jgi:hypothetical protein
MNQQRDTDRRLRAWLADGAAEAPERFVWAALDQIELLPQRRAWRTRLDGLAIRLRPAAAVVGVATAVIVAVALVTRLTAPDVGTSPSRALEVDDLPTIVVWDDTMPATWTLDNLVSNPTEVWRTPIRSMTRAEIEVVEDPAGYLGGRFVNFSGPDAAFMSWGAVFEEPADAAAALPFIQNEMTSSDAWGFGPGERVPLGDDGWLYQGQTTAFVGQPTGVDPIPGAIYLWRDGNTLLAAGGWFDFDPDELRAVAEGMDARATRVARREP